MDPLQSELRSLGLRPSNFLRRPAEPLGFEVIRELSRGGQGVVYEAIQRSTGRRVALKIGLARELPGSGENERFRREVRLLASLRHESLPTVFESGIEDGWRWLAMEFVEGVDLASEVRRARADPRRIVELCAQASDAVALAHRHGIVHRDLKPSNILIDGAGKPVVVDFGLAKRFSASALEDPDVTRAGAILGSPLWLAPEQIHSPDEVGPQADVYALGRVLYHLLSEAHPYRGDPREAKWLQTVRDREPLRLRRLVHSAVDPILEAVVMKAIERDPARRYPDAAALGADCRAWLEGRETTARPDGLAAKIRRRARERPHVFKAAVVLAAVLAAAAGGWWRSAEARWERRVHAALQLPPAPSLSELWRLHLDAPAGARPRAATALSGPPGTHYALLARYLAEPCLGRVALPARGSPSHYLRTAPLGDVAVVQARAAKGSESSLWLGRDPDYDWVRLPELRGIDDWHLAANGRTLASRTRGGTWRLWELTDDDDSPLRELPWVGERGVTALALAWSDTEGAAAPAAGMGAAVALIRGPGSAVGLVRARDGAELRPLPRLDAELAGSERIAAAAVSPGGQWLVVYTGDADPVLVSLEDPSAPLRRLPPMRPRSLEFVDPATLAVETGGLRLLELEQEEATMGRLLFATNNRAVPTWLRGHAFVARDATSSIQLFPRDTPEAAVHWPTPATVLATGSVLGRGQLLTLDADGYLSRWDVSQEPDGAIVPPWRRLFPAAEDAQTAASVFGIAFSPAGDRVAVSLVDPPRVRVCALRGPPLDLEFSLPGGEAPNCLDWSREGEDLLAIGGLSGRVYLWSVEAGGESGRPTDPILYGELGGDVHAVAFSPDGRELLAGGRAAPEGNTGRIRVWRVGQPGAALRTLEDPAVGRVTSLAFGGGGGWLVAGTANSDRLQWLDPALEGGFAAPTDPPAPRQRVTRDLGALGAGAVSGHRDGTLRYGEPGGAEGALFDLESEPFSVAVHPDGVLVAAGAADGRVLLLTFDGQRFALVASIPFPALGGPAGTRRVFRVRFSPDGRYLVAGGEPDTVPCVLDLVDAERCLAGNLESVLAMGGEEPRGAALARVWAAAVRDASAH